VQHLDSNSNKRVSLLNISADTITTVVDFTDAEPSSFIVGGPNDTFFVQFNTTVRQYKSDGTYTTWGTCGVGSIYFYSSANKMYAVDNGAIYEVFSDGSYTQIASGFTGEEIDVAADSNDNVYIISSSEGKLSKATGGTTTLLTDIMPDLAHIMVDSNGKLYGTNLGTEYTLAEVDISTGDMTSLVSSYSENPCYVLSPSDFIILDDGTFVFASWASGQITYYDPNMLTGKQLIAPPYYSTNIARLGSDGKIYMSVDLCTASGTSSTLMAYDSDGNSETIMNNLNATIRSFVFDSNNGLFMNLSSDTATGIFHYTSFASTGTEITSETTGEYGDIAYNPITGNVYGVSLSGGSDTTAIIHEYSTSGYVNAYTVSTHKAYRGFTIDASPVDGTLYAISAEDERHDTGPDVERWIFQLDLDAGTTSILAQKDLEGVCCPYYNFSIGANGNIWWILNPDFWLYRVTPEGDADAFSCYTPIDTAYVLNDTTNDIIYLLHPNGIDKITRD